MENFKIKRFSLTLWKNERAIQCPNYIVSLPKIYSHPIIKKTRMKRQNLTKLFANVGHQVTKC